MESWASGGEGYVRSLLHALRLRADLFPWKEADFASKVFSTDRTISEFTFPPQPPRLQEPPSEAHRTRLARACCTLRELTGRWPPWGVCAAQNASAAANADCSAGPGEG